jgi:RNA-directed DNA polymerase
MNVLEPLSGHPSSFAYQRGRSIVDCATPHIGARWLIKLDLHDFFGTIAEPRVFRTFRRLGYDRLLAFELARLTTRAEGAEFAPWAASRFSIEKYVVDRYGRLPQGAPTSGQLANAAATRLDQLLSSYALERNLAYTRYSDDLTFSSGEGFSREGAVRHVHALGGLIRAGGFNPHKSKTRIVPPGARHVVLGLLVEDQVRLLPEHARRIENHLRGCENFGIGQHAEHRGFASAFSFVNHLDGWIAFAMGVDRERATIWRRRLQDILARAGIRDS